jgi:nucleotide-binding universal stress UspA family protein
VAGTIVVGVDGSEGSRAALRWAIAEGALRDASVDAVITWQSPTYAYTGVAVMPPVVELAGAATAALDETLAAETAGLTGAEADVTITPVVVEGPAAAVLIERSRTADLLVVGSRGYGGFRGLLLGSVSHQCASHARCPVVVVPLHDED